MNPAKYSCDECGREGSGTAIGVTGWFSYPSGWFIKDEAAVCSEECALTHDAREMPTRDDLPVAKPFVDVEVDSVGAAALVGFFAGAALRKTTDLIGEILVRMPCERCGRTLAEHPDEKCAKFEPKKAKLYDPTEKK